MGDYHNPLDDLTIGKLMIQWIFYLIQLWDVPGCQDNISTHLSASGRPSVDRWLMIEIHWRNHRHQPATNGVLNMSLFICRSRNVHGGEGRVSSPISWCSELRCLSSFRHGKSKSMTRLFPCSMMKITEFVAQKRNMGKW